MRGFFVGGICAFHLKTCKRDTKLLQIILIKNIVCVCFGGFMQRIAAEKLRKFPST